MFRIYIYNRSGKPGLLVRVLQTILFVFAGSGGENSGKSKMVDKDVMRAGGEKDEK